MLTRAVKKSDKGIQAPNQRWSKLRRTLLQINSIACWRLGLATTNAASADHENLQGELWIQLNIIFSRSLGVCWTQNWKWPDNFHTSLKLQPAPQYQPKWPDTRLLVIKDCEWNRCFKWLIIFIRKADRRPLHTKWCKTASLIVPKIDWTYAFVTEYQGPSSLKIQQKLKLVRKNDRKN
jgi:hypothetical protein